MRWFEVTWTCEGDEYAAAHPSYTVIEAHIRPYKTPDCPECGQEMVIHGERKLAYDDDHIRIVDEPESGTARRADIDPALMFDLTPKPPMGIADWFTEAIEKQTEKLRRTMLAVEHVRQWEDANHRPHSLPHCRWGAIEHPDLKPCPFEDVLS